MLSAFINNRGIPLEITLQSFLVLLAEPVMQVIVLIVFGTGVVRGFSGFGSGMIIGPPTAALLGPQMALAIVSILDAFPTIPLAWSARKNVNWNELIPVVFGYALLVPVGIWLLKSGDPTALRWFISISILIAVAILWSGWKYFGPRSKPVSISFGALGGFMGAAAALPGPSVLIYWLASAAKAIEVRANMIWYLFLTDLIIIAGYMFGSIYTAESLVRALICIPGYLLGIWMGSRFFSGTSENTYRRVAFVMILIAAITSLPVLDDAIR